MATQSSLKKMAEDAAYQLSWEHIFPTVIALPCAPLALILQPGDRFQMILDVAPQLLVVLSVMVGFTATAMTILFTAPDVPAIMLLRTSPKQFARLVRYHHSAIMLGLLAAIYSLVMLISCRSMSAATIQGVFGATIVAEWWFMSAWAGLTFYRALRLLTMLLTTTIHQD